MFIHHHTVDDDLLSSSSSHTHACSSIGTFVIWSKLYLFSVFMAWIGSISNLYNNHNKWHKWSFRLWLLVRKEKKKEEKKRDSITPPALTNVRTYFIWVVRSKEGGKEEEQQSKLKKCNKSIDCWIHTKQEEALFFSPLFSSLLLGWNGAIKMRFPLFFFLLLFPFLSSWVCLCSPFSSYSSLFGLSFFSFFGWPIKLPSSFFFFYVAFFLCSKNILCIYIRKNCIYTLHMYILWCVAAVVNKMGNMIHVCIDIISVCMYMWRLYI